MGLVRNEVEKVSLLARLLLSDAELETMTPQLAQIVHYVEQLASLDTNQVEPLAHTLDLVNVLADDVPQPSLPREVALANAPKQDGECFRVPAVLGE